MKTGLILITISILLAYAGPATAHAREEHFTLYPGPCLYDAFDALGLDREMPNTGLGCWLIHDVMGGETFTLTADDGQEPFVVGTADECPGPRTFDPTNPDWWLNDFWVVCNNSPDIDARFTCTGGEYSNGPGDEAGTVPCDGDLLVILFFGTEPEGVTYQEMP